MEAGRGGARWEGIDLTHNTEGGISVLLCSLHDGTFKGQAIFVSLSSVFILCSLVVAWGTARVKPPFGAEGSTRWRLLAS